MNKETSRKTAQALLCAILGAYLSGCGASLGDKVVIGTTGFLEAHNRGRLKHPEGEPLGVYTEEEKRDLTAFIRRTK